MVHDDHKCEPCCAVDSARLLHLVLLLPILVCCLCGMLDNETHAGAVTPSARLTISL